MTPEIDQRCLSGCHGTLQKGEVYRRGLDVTVSRSPPEITEVNRGSGRCQVVGTGVSSSSTRTETRGYPLDVTLVTVGRKHLVGESSQDGVCRIETTVAFETWVYLQRSRVPSTILELSETVGDDVSPVVGSVFRFGLPSTWSVSKEEGS